MLVLSRRPSETLVFPGTQTTVRVVEIKRGSVRLGVDAPPHVEVWRGELAAAATAPAPVRTPPEAIARLVAQRLAVAARGLALLRGQVAAGHSPDAAATLAEVEAELAQLGDRVWAEVGRPAAKKVHAPRPKALLVEDNPQERELLALFLRSEGLDVDTAGDGCDALDYLKARGRPDVVLLDMGLPRLDGKATVQEIRKDPACAGLKIFAVSGHAADEYGLPVGPAGVDGWFQKPVDPAALVRNLSREMAGP
ncbi:MAG TPA: response regulator [Gemmataceae bacterium]|jgi:carbon storage regulator CsrA